MFVDVTCKNKVKMLLTMMRTRLRTTSCRQQAMKVKGSRDPTPERTQLRNLKLIPSLHCHLYATIWIKTYIHDLFLVFIKRFDTVTLWSIKVLMTGAEHQSFCHAIYNFKHCSSFVEMSAANIFSSFYDFQFQGLRCIHSPCLVFSYYIGGTSLLWWLVAQKKLAN